MVNRKYSYLQVSLYISSGVCGKGSVFFFGPGLERCLLALQSNAKRQNLLNFQSGLTKSTFYLTEVYGNHWKVCICSDVPMIFTHYFSNSFTFAYLDIISWLYSYLSSGLEPVRWTFFLCLSCSPVLLLYCKFDGCTCRRSKPWRRSAMQVIFCKLFSSPFS